MIEPEKPILKALKSDGEVLRQGLHRLLPRILEDGGRVRIFDETAIHAVEALAPTLATETVTQPLS